MLLWMHNTFSPPIPCGPGRLLMYSSSGLTLSYSNADGPAGPVEPGVPGSP